MTYVNYTGENTLNTIEYTENLTPSSINYVEYSDGNTLGVYEEETYVSEHPIYLTQFTDDQYEHLETYTIENVGATPLPLGENLAITTYTIGNMEDIHYSNMENIDHTHRTNMGYLEKIHDPYRKDDNAVLGMGENLEITTYTIQHMGSTDGPIIGDSNIEPILLLNIGDSDKVGEEKCAIHEQERIQELSLMNHNMEDMEPTSNIEDNAVRKENNVNYDHQTTEISHEQEIKQEACHGGQEQASIHVENVPNRLETGPKASEFQRKTLTKKQKKELLKSNNNGGKHQQILGKSEANEQQGINKHVQGVKRRLNNSDENQKKTEAVVASTGDGIDEGDVFEQFGRMKIMQELNKTLGRNNVPLEEGIIQELGKTLALGQNSRKSAIEEEINKILDNAQKESNTGGRSERNCGRRTEYDHKGGIEGEKITFQTLVLENGQEKEGTEGEKIKFQTLVMENEKYPSGRHNKPSNLVKYNVFEKEFKITDNDKRVIEEYILKRNQRRGSEKESENKMKETGKDKINSKEKAVKNELEDKQKVSNENQTGASSGKNNKHTKNLKHMQNISVDREKITENHDACSHTGTLNCPVHDTGTTHKYEHQTELTEEVEQRVVPISKPQKRNRRRHRNRRQEAKTRALQYPIQQTNETLPSNYTQRNNRPPGLKVHETNRKVNEADRIIVRESVKNGRKVPSVDISPTNTQHNETDKKRSVRESVKIGRNVPSVDISPTNIQQNETDRLKRVRESLKLGRKSRETQNSSRRGRINESATDGRKVLTTEHVIDPDRTSVLENAKNGRKAVQNVNIPPSTASNSQNFPTPSKTPDNGKEDPSRENKVLDKDQGDKEGNDGAGKTNLKRVEYTRDSLIITFNEKDGTLKIVPRVENGVLVRRPGEEEKEGALDVNVEHSMGDYPNETMGQTSQYTKNNTANPQKENRMREYELQKEDSYQRITEKHRRLR
ncbi:hypothetical protein WDU94_007255 [Cyamophila willieti]